MQFINEGFPVTSWNDISLPRLIKRSQSPFCTPKQQENMQYVITLMQTYQPITIDEFALAEKALFAVEKKMLVDLTEPIAYDHNNYYKVHKEEPTCLEIAINTFKVIFKVIFWIATAVFAIVALSEFLGKD